VRVVEKEQVGQDSLAVWSPRADSGGTVLGEGQLARSRSKCCISSLSGVWGRASAAQ